MLQLLIFEKLAMVFMMEKGYNVGKVKEQLKKYDGGNAMEENTKVVERVKRWLEENGYDYNVGTYTPSETACDDREKNGDTISVPTEVEDVELFMEQFIKSFEEIHELSTLRKQV